MSLHHKEAHTDSELLFSVKYVYCTHSFISICSERHFHGNVTALASIVELRLTQTEPIRNELQDIEDEFHDAREYTDIKAAIPSPSTTQKEKIREGLKQAFFSKTAVSLLVLHFGTLDLCSAYIGIGLPMTMMQHSGIPEKEKLHRS